MCKALDNDELQSITFCTAMLLSSLLFSPFKEEKEKKGRPVQKLTLCESSEQLLISCTEPLSFFTFFSKSNYLSNTVKSTDLLERAFK